jgi:prevent-host-death family protein
MEEVGSYQARINFGELLRRVENGEEFLVTMRGKPIASLTGVSSRQTPRSVVDILSDFRRLRREVSKRGEVLKAGETWKDLSRDGLKW